MLYTLLSRIRFNVSMSPYKSLLGHLEAKVSQEYLCYEQLTHQNKSMLMYLFFLIWYNPWLHVETFYFSFNFTAFFFSLQWLIYFFANNIVKDFSGDMQYSTFDVPHNSLLQPTVSDVTKDMKHDMTNETW